MRKKSICRSLQRCTRQQKSIVAYILNPNMKKGELIKYIADKKMLSILYSLIEGWMPE